VRLFLFLSILGAVEVGEVLVFRHHFLVALYDIIIWRAGRSLQLCRGRVPCALACGPENRGAVDWLGCRTDIVAHLAACGIVGGYHHF